MYRPGVDNSQFRPVPAAPVPPGMMNMGPYGAPMPSPLPSPLPPPMPPPQMPPQMPPLSGRPYGMPQFSFPAPTSTPPSAPLPANTSALRVPGGNLLPRPALVSASLSVLHLPQQAGQAAHFVPPLPPSPPSDNPPPPPPSPPPSSPPPPPSEEVLATPLFPPEPAKPNDPEILKHIEVLVPYVVKNGPRFESITRARQAGDPKFAFLFEDDGSPEAVVAHNYYKWRKQIFALQLQLEAEGRSGKQLEQLKSFGQFHDPNGKLAKAEDMPAVPGSPAMSDMDMEDDFASPPQVREPVGQQEDGNIILTEGDRHSKRIGLSEQPDKSSKEQVVDHQEQVLLHQKQETLLVSSRSFDRGLEVGSPWGSGLSQQNWEKGPARELIEFDPVGDEKFYTSNTSKPNHSSHIVGHSDSRVDKAYVTADIYTQKNPYNDEDGPQRSGRFRSDPHVEFKKGAVVSNQVNYIPRDKIIHQCEDELVSPDRPLNHLTAIAQENRIGRVSRWGTLPPAQPFQATLESHDHGKASPKEFFHDGGIQRREASASPNLTSSFNDAGIMVKEADRSDDSPGAGPDQGGSEEAVIVDEFGRLVRKGGSESDSDREHRPWKQRRTRSRSRSRSISSRSRSRSRSRSIDSRSRSRSPDDSRWRRQTRRRGRWSRSRSRSPRWRRSFSRTPPRDLRRGGFVRGDRDWRNDREYFGRGRRGGRGSGPILCIHYARGRCFRGSACRFFHPDDEVMVQERGVWMREGQIDRDREVGAQERDIWVREGQTERSDREAGPVQDRGAMRELQGERPFREVVAQERGGWMRGIQAERPNQEAMTHEQNVWMREVQPERHERVAMGQERGFWEKDAQTERSVAVSVRNEESESYRHSDTLQEKEVDMVASADLKRQHHGHMAAEVRDVVQVIADREDFKMLDTYNIAEGNDKPDINGEIKESKRSDLVDQFKWSESKGMANKVDIIDDSQMVRDYGENLVPQKPDFDTELEKVRTIDRRREMDVLVEPSVLMGKEKASTGGEIGADNSYSAQVVILSEKSEIGENADVHMQKYTDEKQEVIAGEALAGKIEISSEPEDTDKSNIMGPKSVLPVDEDTKIVAERSIATKSESLSEVESVDLPSVEVSAAAGPKLSPGVLMVERQQVATKVSIEQREELVHEFEKPKHTEPEMADISQATVGLSSLQQLEVGAVAKKFEANPDLERPLPQGQKTQVFPSRPSISGPPLLAPQLSFPQSNIMGPPIPANNAMEPTNPMANSAPSGPFGQPHIGSSQPHATFGHQQTTSLPHSLPPGNLPPYNQSSSFRPPMNTINANQNLPAGGNFNVQQRQPFGHQIFGQPSGAINSHAGPPQSFPPGSIQNRPTFFPGPSMHDMSPQAHGPPNQLNYGPRFAQPGFPQSTMMSQQSLVPSQLGFPSSQPVSFPGQLPAPQQHALPGNVGNIQAPVQGVFGAKSSLPPERPPFQHSLSNDAVHPSVMDSSTPSAYPRTSLVPSAPSVPSGQNPWSLHSSGPPSSAIPARTGEPSNYSYSLTTIPPLSNLIKVPGVAGLPTGDQYDPLSDSLDPNAAAATKPSTYGPLTSAEDGRETNARTSNLENISQAPAGEMANAPSNRMDTVEGETANLNEATADVGVVENVSPPANWSPGPAELAESGQDQAQSKDKKSIRGLKLLRAAVAEHVKELLKPTWREGHMSKEAFKTIAKKAVEKVTGNLPSHHIPKSQEKVDQFMAVSRSKISKLVQGYVDKYLKL